MAVLNSSKSRRSMSGGRDSTACLFHHWPFSVGRSKFTGILGSKEGKNWLWFAASARRGLLKAHSWQQLQLLCPFWHRDVLSGEAWILDSRACSWKNKKTWVKTLYLKGTWGRTKINRNNWRQTCRGPNRTHCNSVGPTNDISSSPTLSK